MHFRYLIITVLMVVAGCSRENDDFSYEYTPLQFHVGFSQSTRLSTESSYSSSFDDGDTVGLYIFQSVEEGVQTANRYKERALLIYSKANNRWNLAKPLNVPREVSSLEFYAYYPYSSVVIEGNGLSFAVQEVQDANGIIKSDLLTAQANRIPLGSVVHLLFEHRMSMVEVEVTTRDHTSFLLYLNNVKHFARFNLDGNMSMDAVSDAATDIQMHRVAGSNKYQALIPQQVLSEGEPLFKTHPSIALMEKNLENNIAFNSGRVKRFNRIISGYANTVYIKPGSFMMGSPRSEKGRNVHENLHEVILTKGFSMNKYEVTVREFVKFLNDVKVNHKGVGVGDGGKKNLYFGSSLRFEFFYDRGEWKVRKGSENLPVAGITYYGAKEYARWAGGTLPTEAQWEYACRAGTNTPYHVGYTLDKHHAHFNDVNPVPVGSYLPNAWGLYDMHGNVSERTLDLSGLPNVYPKENVDPVVLSGTLNIYKGGGYLSSQVARARARAAARFFTVIDIVRADLGFRIIYEDAPQLNKK